MNTYQNMEISVCGVIVACWFKNALSQRMTRPKTFIRCIELFQHSIHMW